MKQSERTWWPLLRLGMFVVVLIQCYLSVHLTSLEHLRDERRPRVSLALIRTIGNSLPPRHAENQSLVNLNFILQHEPVFPDVHKHWILNRIVDQTILHDLVQLLEKHGQSYTILPFELKEYATIPYSYRKRYHGFDDILHSTFFHQELNHPQQRAILDDISHDKNVFVTNNNGARNAMLQHGRALSVDWILPWYV